MAIYRYRLGDINKIKLDHTLFSECNMLDVKGNIYIDIELSSSLKDKIDGMMGKHGYYFYADITSASGTMANSTVMLGTVMDYELSAIHESDKIQFTQVWIDKDKDVIGFKTFLEKSKAGSSIWMGLYDQNDLLDESGSPANLLCSSDKTLVGTESDSHIEIPVNSYSITQNGYYWIATLSNNRNLRWASSLPFRKGFIPALYQNSSTLPTLASSLYRESGGIIYASVKLRG